VGTLAISTCIGTAPFYDDVFPLNVTKIPEPVAERFQAGIIGRKKLTSEISDPREFGCLLRLGYDDNRKQDYCNRNGW
jgi:hypothetical protein